MKINWGTGIAIFFSIFVLFMLFMVYKTSQVDFDLVTEDYYAKEIAYQGVIDKFENYKLLNERVEVSREVDGILLKIPSKALDSKTDISLELFRPSDGKLDRNLSFTGLSEILIPTSDFVKGKYLLKLEWNTEGVGYYFENEFYY